MLQKINGLGEVVVFLIDYSVGQFLYMSESVYNQLGYTPQPFYDRGLDHLYSIMHPDDYPRVLKEYVRQLRKLRDKAAERERLSFISLEFRLKDSEGCWLWFENTAAVLDYTEHHQPQNAIGFLKKIKVQNGKYNEETTALMKRMLFSNIPPTNLSRLTRQRKLFFQESSRAAPLMTIPLQSEDQISISPREKEVLQLIADGYSAREIAAQLFISETTVVSHRKNLLQKFKVKNTAELIKQASKIFWLE